MNRWLNIGSVALYILLLVIVTSALFFERDFSEFWQRILGGTTSIDRTLTIGYSESLVRLHPLANDTASRARLLQVYEPLVRVTPDLSIEPALAISYGALNDHTWEFRLRPRVVMHDGSTLTIDDVLLSFQEARFNTTSQLRDLTSSIEKIEKISDELLHITTVKTDPLLPQKIASILIYKTAANAQNATGTGPYIISNSTEKELVLTRFENYWDILPTYKNVRLVTLTTRDEKIAALKEATVDLLAYIPADIGFDFDYADYRLKELPSLEVNFLLFNFKSVFSDKNLRSAVLYAIDPAIMGRLGHGFTTVADQFVANGIFGFNPLLSFKRPDLEKAKSFADKAGVPVTNYKPITLDIPQGLELVGKTITKQLSDIGLQVSVNSISSAKLSTKIVQQPADMFFFGWRSDVGDASDFLAAVAHSRSGQFGQYNGIGYTNSLVDLLIEESASTLQSNLRLQKLREALKIITSDDVIGVPLFSPDVLYAVSQNIRWQPRVDGYVLAQEVR
ncbi:hypothetical protein KBD59_00590 [Candidatus Gracilibacteria bacterium]|nr:hypothetical protein [Candidatus Gracilibacteria bacterium]